MKKKIVILGLGIALIMSGCNFSIKNDVSGNGFSTQVSMSSLEYTIFINKQCTVFSNILETRIISAKSETKMDKKKFIQVIEDNIDTLQKTADEVQVTMPAKGRERNRISLLKIMEQTITDLKEYKTDLMKNKNTLKYVDKFQLDLNEINGFSVLNYQ